MVGAALKNRCFFDAVPKIVKPQQNKFVISPKALFKRVYLITKTGT